MLIEFSVENFKSFRDRTTFSMIAANIKSAEERLDTENTIPISDDLSLLTSAAIYGKNASGKSNLGAALRFMRDMVLYSSSILRPLNPETLEDELPTEPFLLNAKTRQQPSFFEIVFLLDGTQYRYGFEADATHIVSEWLFYVPSRREYALFIREGQEISVKSNFKEGKGLEEKTRDVALFLSVVAQFNGATAGKIIGWFGRLTITSGLQDDDFRTFTVRCLREGRHKDEIVSFVRSLDVDIDDLLVRPAASLDDFPETPPGERRRRLADQWNNEIIALHPIYGEAGERMGVEGFSADLQESQGTRKLIAMAGPLHEALRHGYVLFIDEMDARLHTHMTAAIVGLFNSRRTNPHGAQLIFVTHDTNLLDNTLLRRDQIWFAEKDRQGGTRLISLVEYRERNNADFEQRYLAGRYGGLPSVGDLSAVTGAAHG
ncbi:MAG: AAA family ATPase [Armatimonadetes bacterium]|nr:AAA family ATPase [Armatimonadota bacterium]